MSRARFFKAQTEENGLSTAARPSALSRGVSTCELGLEDAWKQLMIRRAFWAPFAATTRAPHPQFRSHGVGKCEWGPAPSGRSHIGRRLTRWPMCSALQADVRVEGALPRSDAGVREIDHRKGKHTSASISTKPTANGSSSITRAAAGTTTRLLRPGDLRGSSASCRGRDAASKVHPPLPARPGDLSFP